MAPCQADGAMSSSKPIQVIQPTGEQSLSDDTASARPSGIRNWLTFGFSLALSAIVLYFVFQR